MRKVLIIDTYRDLMEQERLTEQEKVVIEQWKPVLDELDRMENCNNRRHKEKRDMLDMTLCECQNEKEEYLYSEIKLKLSDTDENWLEWIFSRSSADLYQLTGNIELAKSLQTLTVMQKKVVFLFYVHGFSVKDIAALLGSSERNIRKLRERAREHMKISC